MQIINVCVVTPEIVLPDAAVRIAGGRIAEIAARGSVATSSGVGDVFDAGGGTLLPGFIDMHNHGALGEDFMDGGSGTLGRMSRFLASHGVTGFLATTAAAPSATLGGCLDRAGEAMAAGLAGAECLGVHLEGPYLTVARRGMHPAEHCREPDLAEYEPWLATGLVRRLTASLELPGGEDLLAACNDAGVLLSLGHTACGAADVNRWADAGLRHVTHLYNAMTRAEKHGGPIRIAGCVEGALADPRIACEIVGDGWHVPEHLFRVAALCKGSAGITIASDATLLSGDVAEGVPTRYGGPDGMELIVRGGMATSLDGMSLVGSIATLGDMVPRLLDWLDGDWLALARMMSTNAAGLLGLGDRKGKLRAGYDADMVLVDDAGAVVRTWVGRHDRVGSFDAT